MTTIRDIAERAGVSVATVSRASSHPHLLRPKTLERVRQAIADLDYSPNAIARHLRRRRSETVIVIVPQIENPFFSTIVQGIENIAHANGFRVLLGETQHNQARLDHYAAMVSARAGDGLILLGSLLPTAVKANLDGDRPPLLPLVLACERFDGLQCPHVAIDNVAAARLAVEHLVEQGCRRIATIMGPASNTLGHDRLRGYQLALEQAGLRFDPELVVEGDFSIDAGYAAAARLLAEPLRLDGLFCANDEMAIGAQQAIRQAGLRMPEDIAVIGFDDIRFARYADPPLSTIRQPMSAIGETAMRLMIQLLEERPSAERELILPHELIVRGSSQRKSATAARKPARRAS